MHSILKWRDAFFVFGIENWLVVWYIIDNMASNINKGQNKRICRLEKQQKLFDFLSEHLISIKSVGFVSIACVLVVIKLLNGSLSAPGWLIGFVSGVDYLLENVTYYGSNLCFEISEKIQEKINKEKDVCKTTIQFDNCINADKENLLRKERVLNFYKSNSYCLVKQEDAEEQEVEKE